MTDDASQPGRQPTEEELLAAYKALRVEDLVADTLISLLNLGARKAGLVPGTEDERDLPQVRTAIEAVRALLPLCEAQLGPDAVQVRNALSQLQMAYAQGVGGEGDGGGPDDEGPPPDEEPPKPDPGQPGPAQSSGRLWVPGQ